MIESELVRQDKYTLAKKYIIYRYQRALLRKANTTDESILKLIKNENKELAEENSNKNTILASTQRDYIAGEVSRDLTRRMLLPERISMAHDQGILHFHDADYFIQPIFNCCLINIGDMLDNGTVMNGKMIESPLAIANAGGEAFQYGIRLGIHVGGTAKAGTKKLKATLKGEEYQYGNITKIGVFKNQLPTPYNITYSGTMCCVHNGIISEDDIDDYKKKMIPTIMAQRTGESNVSTEDIVFTEEGEVEQ